VLGRKKALETLNMGDFEKSMVGITAKVCPDTLDESAFAYKDIFDVMRLQEPLVDVVAHVKPIINIKG
jgi:tRNA-splicing ligase RtcB